MCRVTFINYHGRRQNRQKRASSLILLQDGLRLENGPRGMLWIVREEEDGEVDSETDEDEYTQGWTESGETAPTTVSDEEE